MYNYIELYTGYCILISNIMFSKSVLVGSCQIFLCTCTHPGSQVAYVTKGPPHRLQFRLCQSRQLVDTAVGCPLVTMDDRAWESVGLDDG